MNILDKIVTYKKQMLEKACTEAPIKQLMDEPYYHKTVPSLRKFLLDPEKTGVITEFKRQSPSKGIINATAQVETVAQGYERAGASALSILTDTKFFGGRNLDLQQARSVTTLPILRKDFIIDTYQVYEAKAIGASAILLIAAILDTNQAKELGALAHYLGMEVLMELHTAEEMDRLNPYVDVVGINNRNLKTFKVNLEQSIRLAVTLPSDLPKISESGIHDPQDALELRKSGFDGFLIGENFMKTTDPAQAFACFAKALKAGADV